MAVFLGKHSYPLAPSSSHLDGVSVTVVAAPAPDAVLGVPVTPQGKLPKEASVTWQALAGCNFQAKLGETFALPRDKGALVLVGLGEVSELDAARLRDAAAAFARATESHPGLTVALAGTGAVPADVAAQAVVEGILLTRYRYDVAGTAESDDDVSWHPGGCTGFGARLLTELAVDFKPVVGRRH